MFGAAFGQTVETIFSFPNDGSLGESPSGSMAVGPGGHLYGTTVEGGINDKGTAFKITTAGVFTSLGSFDPATTGTMPYSRLINIGDGFLYGVTERNTGVSGDPNGTLFKLDPDNGLSVVFQLPGSGTTPKFPRALLQVEPGAIRVLGSGGPAGFWKVPLDGGTRTSFSVPSSTVGAFAYSAILASDGLIYGTTTGINTIDSAFPVERGTIFRVAPDGSNLEKLHDCAEATGTTPTGGMVQATDGNFYGTMAERGANGKGVIFRLTPDGGYTVIHNFNGLSRPLGDLIQATDGFLYGTAQTGGSGIGGVFRVNLSGVLTVLHTFNGNSGSFPVAGLTQAPDGNLYGVVYNGGGGGKGAIFRVKLSLPPPNRAPVALDDIGVTTNTAVVIDVLANDFDPESGVLTVADVSTPAHGTATILGDNTIQYTPGGTFAGADTFNYAVRDSAGLTTEATVTIQSDAVDAVVYSGVFNGLLNLDPDLAGATDAPRAQILVVVNELGRFTGSLLTGRKRVSFKGAFDLTDGTAAVKVKLPNGKAVLFLGFRPEEPGTLLAITFGREIWAGSGRPAIPGVVANIGKHTVALEATTIGLPAGYGFGVMQVKANGLVTCVGKHGDGTKLTWGTTLVAATDDAPLIPVFSEPLTGGVSAGVLDSRGVAPSSFAGGVRWIRPPAKKTTLPYSSGFAGNATAIASAFAPAASLTIVLNFGGDAAGSVICGGGPLVNPIGGTFTIAGPPPAALRFAPTLPLKALAIDRKSGLFKGKVLNGTKSVNFIGVVLQSGNIGAGQLSIGGTTAAVELNP